MLFRSSPQIISHIKPESIIVLKNENGFIDKHFVNQSYGKNSDIILEDIMDTNSRPTEIEEKIDMLFRIINEGKFSEAIALIKALKKEIGQDPKFVNAEVLISRKEIIGK